MNGATLPAADLAMKIIGIAVAATIVAGLIGMGAQAKREGSDPLPRTAGQPVAPGH